MTGTPSVGACHQTLLSFHLPADVSAGGDVAAALAALVSRANAHPGSSWRVGVGKDLQAQDLAAAKGSSGARAGLLVSHSSDGGAMVVRKSIKDRIKPASMVVSRHKIDFIVNFYLGPC